MRPDHYLRVVLGLNPVLRSKVFQQSAQRLRHVLIA
jgi:hypothetical protein